MALALLVACIAWQGRELARVSVVSGSRSFAGDPANQNLACQDLTNDW
jgi:hypothetical protein